MPMKKINVDELKPGMVFDRAVYIDMNNILAAPMVPVKEEDIQRLKKWGIQEVETAGNIIKQGSEARSKRMSVKSEVEKLTQMIETGNSEITAKVEEKSINTLYDDGVNMLEDVFTKVRNGAGYDRHKILGTVDRLIEKVKENKNEAIQEVTVEHTGKYLYTLGVSVAILSIVTGISLGFDKNRLVPLATGALLHDIGMVRVPTYITDKKDTLTQEEYNRIKTHPIYGYRIIIKELDLGNDVATVVLQHHEAYDGSGYPRRLKGKDISVYARIVNICDVYVAMTRKRSYREEHLSYQAMKSILAGSSRKFDPDLVRVFLSNMAIYPVGSVVQLNNGVIGVVVSANSQLPLRPKISVLIDEFGDRVSSERIIDLQEAKNLFIKKPLPKSYIKQVSGE